jgi:hypothetical protein
VQLETKTGRAHFPSIHAWIFTEIRGWTLADRLTDAQFDLLESEAEFALREFFRPDGAVEFDAPAHIAALSKDQSF